MLTCTTLCTSVCANEDPHQMQQDPFDSTVTNLEMLFTLMQERLSLVHEMAKYKWEHNLKDETLLSEQINLVEDLTDLEKAFAIELIDAQMKAATLQQQNDYVEFEKLSNVVSSEENLNERVVPRLVEINEKLVSTAIALSKDLQNETLPTFIKDLSYTSFKAEGVEKSVFEEAVAPLFQD